MPEDVVMTPAEALDPARLETLDDPRVRAEFIRKAGAGRCAPYLREGDPREGEAA
jgi:hypothetical protein